MAVVAVLVSSPPTSSSPQSGFRRWWRRWSAPGSFLVWGCLGGRGVLLPRDGRRLGRYLQGGPEYLEAIKATHPMGRLHEPSEVWI